MVKIRLMRVGKRKQPTFRVVVADSRSPRDGRIIESIGHYHPRNEPSLVNIDNERALYWLQKGAQPSDSVRHLLRISGAWTEFTGEPQKVAPGETATTTAAATPAAKPATPKKATPAASVTAAADQGDDAEVAETPESVDQQEAAPEAEPAEPTDAS
jgi:small subunit ribosomal protein S16